MITELCMAEVLEGLQRSHTSATTRARLQFSVTTEGILG